MSGLAAGLLGGLMGEVKKVPYVVVMIIILSIVVFAYLLPHINEDEKQIAIISSIQREVLLIHAQLTSNHIQDLNAELEVLQRQKLNMILIGPKADTEGVDSQILRLQSQRDLSMQSLSYILQHNPDLNFIPSQ